MLEMNFIPVFQMKKNKVFIHFQLLIYYEIPSPNLYYKIIISVQNALT